MGFLYSLYHWLWALIGAFVYRRPSRNLFVVGVTGTKGKTTVLELLDVIFTEAGKKTAVLSSIKRKIGDKAEENKLPNTMPGRWRMQKFLKRAVDAGCEYAFVEVTSQGAAQHRHKFIDWDAALFLNLTPEHVEAHGSFEKYRRAKTNFFQYLGKSGKTKKYFFINKDDQDAVYFKEAAGGVPDGEIVFFSKGDVYKMVEAVKKDRHPDWLKSDFNIENLAAAVSVARARGIDQKVIKQAIGVFKGLKGRMDFVAKTPFKVVIDYAHTPASLQAVYRNLRENYKFSKNSKLICVFGSAGGGRDKWKRPELGNVAASYCDKLVLTSEDPYDENPNQIISEIKSGISSSQATLSSGDIYEIVDRREAIKKAISLARPDDTVVMTGKGSELWFYLADGKKVPWDESEIVRELLKKK